MELKPKHVLKPPVSGFCAIYKITQVPVSLLRTEARTPAPWIFTNTHLQVFSWGAVSVMNPRFKTVTLCSPRHQDLSYVTQKTLILDLFAIRIKY